MARESVEQEWVIPTIDRLTKELALGDPHAKLGVSYSKLISSGVFHRIDDRLIIGFNDLAELLAPVEAICRLYPQRLGTGYSVRQVHVHRIETAARRLLQAKYKGRVNFDLFRRLITGTSPNDRRPFMFKVNSTSDWWLRELGAAEMFEGLNKAFIAIKRDIERRGKKRTAILDEFI